MLGLGRGPRRRGVRGGAGGATRGRSDALLATLQRLRDAGIGVDAQVEGSTFARRRARPPDGRPGPDRRRARHERRGRVRADPGLRMPGYVAAPGPRAVDAIRAIRAAGGLASLAHFPEAPTQLSLLAIAGRRGAERARDPPSSFAPPRARRCREVARDAGAGGDGRDGLPRRLRARTRRATPGWCIPELAARRAGASGPRSVADARGDYHGRPNDHPSAARPRHRPARHGPGRPARPARRPPTSASTEFRPEVRIAAVVLRLDARLPDEQERLRGDGRAGCWPRAAPRRRRWTPPTSS